MRAPIFACLSIALASVVACGGGDEPQPEALVGTWHATSAVFTSVANPDVYVDVVARGTSVTLVLEESTFTLTMADPGDAPEITTGSWTSSIDTMSLAPSGQSWGWQFDMVLQGNELALTGATVAFDIEGNGNREEALLDVTLVK